MISVNAYYNGNEYITEEPVPVKQNQHVIITLLDDFHKPARNLKKYVGRINKEDSDLISQAVKENRKVDIHEW